MPMKPTLLFTVNTISQSFRFYKSLGNADARLLTITPLWIFNILGVYPRAAPCTLDMQLDVLWHAILDSSGPRKD
jgi:hypothetical protein